MADCAVGAVGGEVVDVVPALVLVGFVDEVPFKLAVGGLDGVASEPAIGGGGAVVAGVVTELPTTGAVV